MDPDKALDQLREMVNTHRRAGEPSDSFMETFEALDEWMSRGGYAPTAWNVGRPLPSYLYPAYMRHESMADPDLPGSTRHDGGK